MSYEETTIVENNGFVWRLFRETSSPNKTECALFLRGKGMHLKASALMFKYISQ